MLIVQTWWPNNICNMDQVADPGKRDMATFNVNMFLKSVSTSKSRVTYDLDTDRVTYDLDTNTTTHKIIGVVGSPLYLATPVSTTLPKSHLSL